MLDILRFFFTLKPHETNKDRKTKMLTIPNAMLLHVSFIKFIIYYCVYS